ncbi:IclR family transcriptional regulator [Mycolicibacterium sp. CBMA 226]|uniref:IclR family transcriptional regulator n=1 Tax=Mycolicibacterium sp. CBMA 226 TaxID=2606611 RepID=UPI001FB6F82E|nr:IclR family transcriptional regulator [Mycolicibacterium sp. CBMA 226]
MVEQRRDSMLARAVRVFETFSPDDTELSVSEIARRSSLHVSTASRLIAELVEHGLLERGPARQVRMGRRMWELGLRASPTLFLRDTAMPYLEGLHAAVGHHAQLGVLDGDDVLFIERLSTRRSVEAVSRIAGRLPLHVSACGHVLLAYGPPELTSTILAEPLTARTRSTITDPSALARRLAEVRAGGYAYLRGHVREDAAALAVPVRDGVHNVVASLSVVVPDDDGALGHLPTLVAAATGMSRALSTVRFRSARD